MPITKCGIQFSWDTPMWCKGGEDKKCKNCPLNEKYNENITINEHYYDNRRND